MKLKRFLLRYDPPGVGLEVEEDGTSEVHHKNMPAAQNVHSVKDIKALVDDLIASEPQLLTRRRHRPALIQLLGRLYQKDVDPDADDSGGEGSPIGAAAGNEKIRRGSEDEHELPKVGGGQGVTFQEGELVVMVGLTAKQQVYNGEMGTVIKAKGEKDKYEVQFFAKVGDESDVVKVKGREHLVPMAAKGTALAVGMHVVIRGLRNHVELNGCLGRVVECHTDTHRYEVRATESGQLFIVKQGNLVPIDMTHAAVASTLAASMKENVEPNASPRGQKQSTKKAQPASAPTGNDLLSGDDEASEFYDVGSIVALKGLKTAMAYNGQQAEVLSVDRARGRYEIRLCEGGGIKTIRAENVQFVSAAASNKLPNKIKK